MPGGKGDRLRILGRYVYIYIVHDLDHLNNFDQRTDPSACSFKFVYLIFTQDFEPIKGY